ncbi:MAG: gliding motility-associated C-terminal domain-containing protein [Bacteroidetes bacterium]|nr:gliding motility-associated C-terminal domain-containing protein [Bacteroidota bacterium]MBS1629222.1 gliding motility-associated C-terminal domain-containing protein [Bacteroidota bacterium]
MNKRLLLAFAALLLLPAGLYAQSYFDLETDTACVGQKIHLAPHTMNASSYYWGFCSGYLLNKPIEENLGGGFGFDDPSGIEIAKDGGNYYGFVVNTNGNQLLRLDFGKKLNNIPTVTNFGSIDTTVPPSPNSVYLMQDSGKWFLFVCGGGGGAPSSIARFDFGNSLSNVPNGVRFPDVNGLLNDPQGIFVSRDGGVYYGFVVNKGNDRLIRLNFGNNISRTPTYLNLGNPGNDLSAGNDIAPFYDNGNWYFLVPNTKKVGGGGSSYYNINKIYFGNTLSNTPVSTVATGYRNYTDVPTAISLTKDCGEFKAFVTNAGDNSILRVDIPSLTTSTWSGEVAVNNTFNQPEDISRILRDKDSLYAFVINRGNNTLTRLTFPQCHNSSIQSSTDAIPPAYTYDTAGRYNILLVVNEGLPNMEVDCQQIEIRNIPPMTIAHDTLICQGDTVTLFANTEDALNYYYSPHYNLTDTQGSLVRAYPKLTTQYFINIPMKDGCIVDTVIKVDVSDVRADAGPDRSIADGAKTIIGGPNTLIAPKMTYQWSPPENIDDVFSLFPTVSPRTTKSYILKVTNTLGCISMDTVVVKVLCNSFNLPNAFAPGNHSGEPTTFGMKNRQISVLYYFRIFDRWGRQVFSTSDPTKEWDGTYNGDPAPFGVYVWEAEGACVNQERMKATGNVTLIR